MATRITAKYWLAVCYPENMKDNWQEDVGDILQLPYAYCIHDKDKLAEYQPKDSDEEEDRLRKVHVHFIIAFPNTTTYSHVLKIFERLNKEGYRCVNRVEPAISIRGSYEYLIHNTEECKKKKKYLYPENERITGNNFDIGAYEQLSLDEKERIKDEIEDAIMQNNFYNYKQIYWYVVNNFDNEYRRVLRSCSGHFERLCKGNYQDMYDKFKHDE